MKRIALIVTLLALTLTACAEPSSSDKQDDTRSSEPTPAAEPVQLFGDNSSDDTAAIDAANDARDAANAAQAEAEATRNELEQMQRDQEQEEQAEKSRCMAENVGSDEFYDC